MEINIKGSTKEELLKAIENYDFGSDFGENTYELKIIGARQREHNLTVNLKIEEIVADEVIKIINEKLGDSLEIADKEELDNMVNAVFTKKEDV